MVEPCDSGHQKVRTDVVNHMAGAIGLGQPCIRNDARKSAPVTIGIDDPVGSEIGRASCRERVCT